jgi:murein DD-endopeptidase MepM/ murein hydrolase activator NlpD
MARKAFFAIAVLALTSSACSRFVRYEAQTEVAAEKAAVATRALIVETTDAVVSASQSTAQRMMNYVERKDLLKTFREAGEYSEDALLDVMRHASIGGFNSGRLPKFKRFDMPELPAEYAGDFRWPVEAGVISSEYGKRFGRLHKGMDVAADVGEPIHAIASGYVVYASNKIAGYGNLVILRHDETLMTLYAHNSKMKVKTGQWVAQGDVIALLGNTGISTGPHTHFEFRRLDAALNPRELLGHGPFEEPPPRAELEPLTEFLAAWRE